MFRVFPRKYIRERGMESKGVYKVVIIIMYLGTDTKKGKPNSEKVQRSLSRWCR